MATSSPPPVNTIWPFLPLMIAVPVSWHIGSTPPAATDAFLSRSRATNRSLSLASGSSRIARSCERWAGRRKCAISRIASAVSERIASLLTLSIVPSGVSTVSTPSVVRRRYSVVSSPSGRSSVNQSGEFSVAMPLPYDGKGLAKHFDSGLDEKKDC